MKLILIAAALAATPALAQTTTPTDSSGMNGTAAGQSAPAPQTDPASQPMQPGGTPMGGYQPAGAPGTQGPSPSQAYPAPAPLDHYPPCKPGQYDQCMQVSDMHGMHHKMMAKKPMHHSMPMKKATTTTTTTSSQ